VAVTAVPILRTSERRAFKSCQAKWWWGYREGLKPIGSERTPLWFGTGFHLCLALWYIPGTKRGIHPSETWEQYAKDSMHSIKVKDATEETVAEYEDGAELGKILTAEYVKHYGNDGSWDFIQAEQTFSLDVPWPREPERQGLYTVDDETGLLVQYKGTYDGVYRDLADGKIKLLETKTARSVQTSHLTLDDQAGSYWAVASRTLRAMGKIGPKERIHGITYNFIRKGKPDERPRDAKGYATNKPVKADYIAAIEAERQKMPAPGPAGSWIGPPLTGKETLAMLEQIASKLELTVLGERSKVQPPPLFVREPVWRTSVEQRSQLLRIQDEAVQMQAIRDGLLPITKNPTDRCGWCDYFHMCELQERGGEWKDFKRVAFRVEDPYADHRKSSDE
jgi:hypothetical protein